MRILLVEDDKKIAEFVAKGLRQEGYQVDWTQNGEDGLALATTKKYAAAIVDLMLPERDGISLIEEMRRKRVATPVIILSAKSTVDDRVRGLQAGSDDYLTKPFSFAELVARLQAITRRAVAAPAPSRLSFADIVLDPLQRQVTRAGKTIELQAKEFSLLDYFLRNAGRVLSKTMILEHVWNYDFDPQTNVVDVLVCRLRNKLGRAPELIHTLRGVGYVLREE